MIFHAPKYKVCSVRYYTCKVMHVMSVDYKVYLVQVNVHSTLVPHNKSHLERVKWPYFFKSFEKSLIDVSKKSSEKWE